MSANGEADKRSVAARLVGMAQERYLLGVSEDGEPFGAERTRPHIAMLLRGGRTGLRADLAARYFAETGAVAGGQALTDATLILEGLAAAQAPEKLHLRVAGLFTASARMFSAAWSKRLRSQVSTVPILRRVARIVSASAALARWQRAVASFFLRCSSRARYRARSFSFALIPARTYEPNARIVHHHSGIRPPP